jgi:septum formation inhibitor MinC
MSSIRGRGRSLEIAVDRVLAEAGEELRQALGERPDFYRGSRAVANLGSLEPPASEIVSFRELLAGFGITLDGVAGPESLAPVLAELELAYVGAAPVPDVAALPRSRAPRTVALSADARSLAADFAGARADLAKRRRPRSPAPAPAAAPAAAAVVQPPVAAPAGVATLYHRGTLRGGQALHNLGNIVVIGDVNPGAELIASGDIVVFGALRGVAHAGAQGDRSARVIALELAPTQLRIATSIAADAGPHAGREPEHAYIIDDRIAVVAHAAANFARREATQ